MLAGADNGSIYILSLQKKKISEFKSQTPKLSVEIARWDLASPNYFICMWIDGSLSLFDLETEKEIQVFETQKKGLSGLCWLKSVPGGFVTFNEKLAFIKLWSVSNKLRIFYSNIIFLYNLELL